MTDHKAIDEDYLCEVCGNTTPVPNDYCPSCGSPMLVSRSTKTQLASDDDLEDGLEDLSGRAATDGTESLEQLQDEEAKEFAEESQNDFSGNE